MDYTNSAFILVRAPSKVMSTRKIASRAEHKKLIAEALEKGYLVYYSTTTKRDGKEYAKQPWALDFGSVPKKGRPRPETRQKIVNVDQEPDQESEPKAGIFCPYCDKSMKSTSGRTLHVKKNHPDKLEEYKKNK